MITDIIIGSYVAVVSGFLGWIAVKVISQGQKLVELEEKIKERDKKCEQRTEDFNKILIKLEALQADTLHIRVALGENPHV